MKKILLSFAVACVSLAASAQGYVGGSVGIASSKTDGSDAVTTYQFLPEIGVNLDENWSIGTVVGWGKGDPVQYEGESRNYFKIAPYARYTFVHSKYVNAFRRWWFLVILITITLTLVALLLISGKQV